MKIKTKKVVFKKTINHFYFNSASMPSDAELTLQVDGFKITGTHMKYTAKLGTIVLLAIAAVADAAGNPIDIATLGPLAWASSDESIATVTANDDGTASVNPTGKAGTVQITVQGDSDPTTPEFFSGSLDLTYLPGEAATVQLTILDNPDVTPV